jgi:hypothetical protein
MTEIKSHRDLIAWQRAMDLIVAVYATTARWPKDELYGLTSQARRSAVSVAAPKDTVARILVHTSIF